MTEENRHEVCGYRGSQNADTLDKRPSPSTRIGVHIIWKWRSPQEDQMFIRNSSMSSLVLRLGLGLGFLSAVADRFGLWGAFGQPNVEWGNYSRFLDYTHSLNWYWPAGMIPALGTAATGTELLLGLLVLVGWHTRLAVRLSGSLLIVFATAMTIALGVKAVLNYAVLTGIGGSFLLANCEIFSFSVDELLSRRARSKERASYAPVVPDADETRAR
jgi:uncharacterized membrane protein YphA (DoxX/SURF4 family)